MNADTNQCMCGLCQPDLRIWRNHVVDDDDADNDTDWTPVDEKSAVESKTARSDKLDLAAAA